MKKLDVDRPGDDARTRKKLLEENKALRDHVRKLEKFYERQKLDDAARPRADESDQQLLEQSFDAVIIHAGGKIAYANHVAAGLLGAKRPEDMLGMPVLDIVHPDYLQIVRERIANVSNVFIAPAIEEKLVGLDGRVIDAEVMSVGIAYKGMPAIKVVFRDISQRKRAEEALLKSEKFLNNVLESIQDGISILDRDLNIVRTNHVLEEWHPYMKPLAGKKCYYVYHCRSEPCEVCPSIRAINTGKVQSDIIPLHGEHGKQKGWLELFAYPLIGDDGSIVGVIEHVRDITRRKQMEEALQFEHSQLLSIFDSIDEVIYVTDPNTYEVLYANKGMQEKFGKPFLGGTCYREFQNKDAPCEFCTNDIILKNKGKLYRWEFHNPTVGRDFLIVDKIIKWPDGRDVRFEIATDITDQKRMENALRESRARLKSILSSAPTGIGVAISRVIKEANAHLCEMTGYSREELLGQNSRILYPAQEEYERVGREKYGMLDEKGIGALETRWRRKDGAIIDVLLSSTPVVSGDLSAGVTFTALDITERKRAEKALLESESRLKHTEQIMQRSQEAGKVGSWWLDLRKNSLWWSPETYRMFGLPAETKLDYETFLSTVHEEDRASVDRAWKEALVGKPYDIEHRAVVDGKVKWMHEKAVLDFEESGTPVSGIGTVVDITERKQAERSLKLTQFSIDRASDMVFWVAPDGHFTYVNDAACSILGYTREELLSMSVFDINTVHNKSNWQEHKDELKRRGSITFENTFLARDGRSIPVEISVNYLEYGGQEYNCASVRDITERKRAESALMESEERFRSAFDQAAVGMTHLDLEARFTRVNQKFCDITGYSRDELLARRVADITYPPDMPEESVLIERMLAGEFDTFSKEKRYVRKDGGLTWIHLTATTIREQGAPKYMLGVIEDITERKQAEEALKAAKAEADLYVDLMGHDISNMNQITMGYLEIMQNILGYEGRLDASHGDLLDKAIGSLKNSSQLIGNVKKLQREKMGLYRPEVVDVGRILEDVVAQFRDVPGRDVRVNYRPVQGCMVMANELLKDVFINLIGNAVKHTTGPITINVEACTVNEGGRDYCKVTVEDDGPGIPDALKESLFSRLSLEATRAKGKGFGLCLIKMLVDDYRGRFWVEDRVPGDHKKGARFIVMLPSYP